MCFKECEQNELRGRPWVKLPRATVHFVRFYIRRGWQAREVHSADADWYWIANLPLRLLRRVIFLTSVQVHTFGPSCNTFSPVTNVDQQTTSPLTELRSELKQRIERQQSAYHAQCVALDIIMTYFHIVSFTAHTRLNDSRAITRYGAYNGLLSAGTGIMGILVCTLLVYATCCKQ